MGDPIRRDMLTQLLSSELVMRSVQHLEGNACQVDLRQRPSTSATICLRGSRPVSWPPSASIFEIHFIEAFCIWRHHQSARAKLQLSVLHPQPQCRFYEVVLGSADWQQDATIVHTHDQTQLSAALNSSSSRTKSLRLILHSGLCGADWAGAIVQSE